jgi:hypothetical protein
MVASLKQSTWACRHVVQVAEPDSKKKEKVSKVRPPETALSIIGRYKPTIRSEQRLADAGAFLGTNPTDVGVSLLARPRFGRFQWEEQLRSKRREMATPSCRFRRTRDAQLGNRVPYSFKEIRKWSGIAVYKRLDLPEA